MMGQDLAIELFYEKKMRIFRKETAGPHIMLSNSYRNDHSSITSHFHHNGEKEGRPPVSGRLMANGGGRRELGRGGGLLKSHRYMPGFFWQLPLLPLREYAQGSRRGAWHHESFGLETKQGYVKRPQKKQGLKWSKQQKLLKTTRAG